MRARNLTAKTPCRYCGDSGWVVQQLRTMPVVLYFDAHGKKVACAEQAAKSERAGSYRVEEVAPCPRCEQGYANEFPGKDDRGAEYFPFGQDGFWRGRDTSHIQPEPDSTPLLLEENRKKLRESMGQFGRHL